MFRRVVRVLCSGLLNLGLRVQIFEAQVLAWLNLLDVPLRVSCARHNAKILCQGTCLEDYVCFQDRAQEFGVFGQE